MRYINDTAEDMKEWIDQHMTKADDISLMTAKLKDGSEIEYKMAVYYSPIIITKRPYKDVKAVNS